MSDPGADGVPDEPLLALPDPVEVEPGHWRLAPVGEIDMSNAASLRSAGASLADGDGITVELDLSEVSYLDSSGIGAVVELLRALEARGGSLHIIHPSGIVARVLELSGILPLLGDQPS